ncbi:Alpha/Beta hydrolase protein [Dactylonectria estremocensis]|uniref:Alpha/Beta hydrolase protein n=1 Tax=Dactylonectria estremocensis TaxID=1079267 RepID=A0A9P9EEC0_9HYPO|nr:Alpha/Beta hydrolase protein [Dactylonectria estremocensis]
MEQVKKVKPDSDNADPQLWSLSLNGSATETIVLLHGLGTSHNEWRLVWPYLTAYHLLVVDLAGHSGSSSMRPTAIPAQVEHVAALIRSKARGGTAHVVGLSMGGFVAVELARTHPQLVRSAFATGAAPFTGIRMWAAKHPQVLGVMNTVMSSRILQGVASWLDEMAWSAQGLTVPEELKLDMKGNKSSEVTIEVFSSFVDIKLDGMEKVVARTLVVAGGRMDDVAATKSQGAALRIGCPESKAAVVKDAYHPWNLQLPELFAQGILCWVEQRELPKEFEELV